MCDNTLSYSIWQVFFFKSPSLQWFVMVLQWEENQYKSELWGVMTYQVEKMPKVGLSSKNILSSLQNNSDLEIDRVKVSSREEDMTRRSLSLTVGLQ